MTKFRIPIYSYSTKEFLCFGHMTISHGTVEMSPSICSNDIVYGDEERAIGICAENKQEIYEGDIIRTWWHKEFSMETASILIKDVKWLYRNHKNIDWHAPMIIGNKHQNPELLKECIHE